MHSRKITNLPSRPVVLYDGDCGFCTLWVKRWMQSTGPAVEYVPFQDQRVGELYPELTREQLEQAVQLVDTDGTVYAGAEAVFRALATNHSRRWPLRLYQRSTLFSRSAESCYRLVARHRSGWSWVTRILWGKHVEHADYYLVRRTFLASLGVIYFVAFISLFGQIKGLIGKNGLEPAAELMSQVRAAVVANNIGLERYHLLPTVCWSGASDSFLRFQCIAGCLLALLLIAGLAPPVCLALMWLLYLSLTCVCGVFLSFQWDNLLLETGLLAIFFGPWQLLPKPTRETAPPRTVLWLIRLLLFKLMFLSGVVKLTSGDQTWRNLTALTRHYETQPLPTWIGWYAHQLPLGFQKLSCAVMFGIELMAPFLIFAPRRLRLFGAAALALLQLCIMLTGNYTFFNWLTLALCLLLLDDFVLAGVWPRRLSRFYAQSNRDNQVRRSHWRPVALVPLAVIFIGISAIQIVSAFRPVPGWASPMVAVYRWLSPFRSINGYGLFRVMTTERPEIILEGSQDGSDWKPYEFPYKAGDLKRRPAFVAPYQPRLDWQMWFAALEDARQNPWFVNLCVRLLQGSGDVLHLLQKNPFPDRPPKYIRARLYTYQFTTPAERKQSGAWWKRQYRGEYLPRISLDMLRQTRPELAE
ncbi:MAG TPA: lipase maturation factor family protein [Candidatus Limnocylindrales bacterium]|nr:lipase maturation factor family protein [Candidatus Limnocylindrales bacterium]